MSAHCTDEACSVCRGADRAQRVEIRDGWVHIDGVRTRPAQPESAMSERNRASAQRGAERRGRRR